MLAQRRVCLSLWSTSFSWFHVERMASDSSLQSVACLTSLPCEQVPWLWPLPRRRNQGYRFLNDTLKATHMVDHWQGWEW